MKCSIKRNSMLSLRLVSAALMVFLALVCFAQPEAPEVSVEIITIDDVDHVRLNWEAVEGAEAYNIYSSNEADPEDWGEPLATVGEEVTEYTTEESIDELGGSYFFHVTADPGLPDWLVLVDGDQFNGDVTIDPFLISKYLVTQEEWIEVMEDNPSWFADDDGVPNHENLPVEMVSWFDTIEYCNRLSIQEGSEPAYSYLDAGTNPDDWPDGWNEDNENHINVSCNWEADGYRLPTEAEWHHAANAGIHDPDSEWRYGSPYEYSGSNDIDEVAWYSGNSDDRTHPVGELASNGLGIYDMSGNVLEWCWDILDFDVFPSGGDNPRGAEAGPDRVLRGGCWRWNESFSRVFHRLSNPPTIDSWQFGFRVAKSIP